MGKFLMVFLLAVAAGTVSAYQVGETVASGSSGGFAMDTRTGIETRSANASTVTLAFSGYDWNLANANRSVSLLFDGVAIKTATGEGAFDWPVVTEGVHTFEHVVSGGGSQRRSILFEGPKVTVSEGRDLSVNGGFSCEIACDLAGATIYYTTDGTTPTTSSSRYTGPFAINPAVTTYVKAIAVKEGRPKSVVTMGTFEPVPGLQVVNTAESEPFDVDTRAGKGVTLTAKPVERIAYSPWWNGASSALVKVNGQILAMSGVEGEALWTPPKIGGTFNLTHEAGGETLTAKFYAVPTYCEATATGWSGEYDGSAHGPSVNVTVPSSGAVVKYALSEKGPYSTSLPDVKDVCTNRRIWYEVSADDYVSITNSALVTITPKSISGATVTLGAGLTYTGSEQTQGVTSVKVGSLTATYSVSGNTGTNAGSYTLTVTGTGNYTGTATKTWSIGKAAVVPPAIKDKTYTGGTLTADVPSDARWAVLGNTGWKAVGSYSVMLKLTDTVNYAWKNTTSDTVILTFRIVAPDSQGLEDALDGIGEASFEDGTWKVTVTNDVAETVEFADNLGKVVVDLAGKNIVGQKGSNGDAVSVPGASGQPAIRIVASGKAGEPTQLKIVDSKPDPTDDVIGGRGGDGTPGGRGGDGIEVVGAAQTGVKISVGPGVGIRGGDGGTDLSGRSRGGDGGNGVTGDVDVNDGSIAGGDGGASANGTGGDGGTGVTGDIGTNNGTVSGGKGGDSANGTPGNDGIAVGGAVGGGSGTIVKVVVEPPVFTSKQYTGEALQPDVPANALYTVIAGGAMKEPGSYPVLVQLKDPVNYKWSTSDGASVYGFFTITEVHKLVPVGGNDDGAGGTSIGYAGVYDGQSHGISFEVKSVPAGGYTVLYGVEPEDGGGVGAVASWSAVNPQFTHVGTRTVWYAVSAEGYDALTNSATVTITPRSLKDAAIGSLSFATVDGVRTPIATLVDDLGNVLGAADADFSWETEESGAMSLVFEGRGDYYGRYEERFAKTNFAVSFNANGGSCEMSEGFYDVGTYYGRLPVPVRPGYLFGGWYESPSFEDSTLVDRNTPVIAEDVTLYAKWMRRALFYSDSVYHVEAAATWNAYLVDASGRAAGTLQIKIGKPNKATAVSKVTVSAVMSNGAKDKLVTTTYDGRIEAVSSGGRRLSARLCESGISGTFAGCEIDGARNVFISKDPDSKLRAAQALRKWQGTYVIALGSPAGYGGLAVEVKAKGKAKVSGSLPGGAKVSGNAQLMVGDRECALAFSSAKKGGELSFLLWFCENGAVECANLNNSSWTVRCANARSGAKLAAGARFRVSANELSRLVPGLSKNFLPDGLAVAMSGGKFAIDKAGKVALLKDKSGFDVAKAGTNPSGLKLSYKTKTCTFAGKFTVYVLVGGKIKKTAVAVAGVVLGGRGYGSATVKKVGSVPVTINP